MVSTTGMPAVAIILRALGVLGVREDEPVHVGERTRPAPPPAPGCSRSGPAGSGNGRSGHRPRCRGSPPKTWLEREDQDADRLAGGVRQHVRRPVRDVASSSTAAAMRSRVPSPRLTGRTQVAADGHLSDTSQVGNVLQVGRRLQVSLNHRDPAKMLRNITVLRQQCRI